MTIAARAATSPELVKFRGDGQASLPSLAIRKPTTIYTAHLDTPLPATTDMVAQVNYSTGSGTLANVKDGMTMYVGTTSGGRELGMCRIRKTPTGSIFYVGEGSEINWLNGGIIYLTIVDEMLLWAKHLRIVPSITVPPGDPTIYVDWDVAYSDQHQYFDPVLLLGPDAILRLTASTVSITWPSVAASYDPSGRYAIASYSWSAPGASATSGLTTATPTFTYNAHGQYKVYCTVILATSGKSFTASRIIFVYSEAHPPETNFQLTSAARGTYSEGGWSFEVEMVANADVASDIYDRTKVILFARDFYNKVEGSIGTVVGMENIICEGWIQGETIQWDLERNTVQFTVSGTQYWLKQVPGFPVGLERAVTDTTGAGTTTPSWTSMYLLTPRMMLWHLLHWRSTLDSIVDVNLTTDTRLMESQDNVAPALWDQLVAIAHDQILADPVCDHYGAFHCYVNLQFTPLASRSAFPTVMTLAKGDWVKDSMSFERYEVSPTSRVELSGVVISATDKAKALFALSPGHVFKHYGQPINQDYLLLADQAQANVLAGAILSYNNRPYDFKFTLAMNNRLIDIAPRQYLAIIITPTDTLRGIAYSGNLVVREVSYEFDENGAPSIVVSAEPETAPDLNVDGDIPPSIPIPTAPPSPTFSLSLPFPPLPTIPLPIIPPGGPPKVAVMIPGKGVFYTMDFDSDVPRWYNWSSGLDAGAIADAWNFIISSKSGKAIFHDYSYYLKGRLWTSSAPGSPWVLKKGVAGGGPIGAVISVGMNESADDQIACIVITAGVGGFHCDTQWFLGTISGVVAGPTTDYGANIGSNIIYAAGCWLGGQNWAPCNLAVITENGVKVETIQDGSNGGGSSFYMFGKGGAACIGWAIANGGWVHFNSSYGFFSPAKGKSLSELGAVLALGAVDSTSDFSKIMRLGGAVLAKSTDHGFSFSTVVSESNGGLCCAGDPNTWCLITAAGYVKYTKDGGATFFDKTGNLQVLAPLGWPNTMMIKTF